MQWGHFGPQGSFVSQATRHQRVVRLHDHSNAWLGRIMDMWPAQCDSVVENVRNRQATLPPLRIVIPDCMLVAELPLVSTEDISFSREILAKQPANLCMNTGQRTIVHGGFRASSVGPVGSLHWSRGRTATTPSLDWQVFALTVGGKRSKVDGNMGSTVRHKPSGQWKNPLVPHTILRSTFFNLF